MQRHRLLIVILGCLCCYPAVAQKTDQVKAPSSTGNESNDNEASDDGGTKASTSAEYHDNTSVDSTSRAQSTQGLGPAVPEGQTLEETLARAAVAPPEHFPNAIHDDRLLGFFQGDQTEYRYEPFSGGHVLGLEANAWLGGDYNRLFLKPEAELNASTWTEGESETDILYSRLVLPFWSTQFGVQYANQWTSGAYNDRFSAAVAIQGLAPGKFEVDFSIYLSENLNVSSALELEYDYRITQRLVAQARVELSVVAQDIEERGLGAGLTDLVTGLRIRYELKREFAPYWGIRYQRQFFGTADRVRNAGGDVAQFYFIGGIRFALI